MSPAERRALETARIAARATLDSIEAALRAADAEDGPKPPPGLVSIQTAATLLNCTKQAATQRARRGAGRKLLGRWWFLASNLE